MVLVLLITSVWFAEKMGNDKNCNVQFSFLNYNCFVFAGEGQSLNWHSVFCASRNG